MQGSNKNIIEELPIFFESSATRLNLISWSKQLRQPEWVEGTRRFVSWLHGTVT